MCTQDKKARPIHPFDKGIFRISIFYVQVKQLEILFVLQYDENPCKIASKTTKRLFFTLLIDVYQGADYTFRFCSASPLPAAGTGFFLYAPTVEQHLSHCLL